MINVEEIYASELDREQLINRTKYKNHEGWFSASSAGSCFKKLMLRREGKQEPKMDNRVMRLLRLGTIVHEDIQKAITNSQEMADIDYSIMMERRVEIPDLKIVGHLDIGIIDKTNGNLKVMDIKTCASYKWRMKFGRNPDKKGNPNYNMQLATYLKALGTELGCEGISSMSLLWYNKDTSALREEHVDISWMDKAMEYWEELNEYSDTTTSEDMSIGSYGVPMENWECKYCGFKDIYCKGV
tara:strand:+ start:1116 stop:1841 length:726 start_codon:yes stop_codon:yes gene_type:complete